MKNYISNEFSWRSGRALKGVLNLLLMTLLVLGASFVTSEGAFADAGPKPSLKILAENMPNGETCYMDLLVDLPAYDNHFRLESSSGFDAAMIEKLKKYKVNHWRPAQVTGTPVPMSGELICTVKNGKCQMSYGYIGLPDRFKIIVVTSGGKMVTSAELRRQAFNSTVRFDFATGRAYETSTVVNYGLQFIGTAAVTLLVEGTILLLFQFNLQRHLRPFLFINLKTQVMLTFLVMLVMLWAGTLMALLAYFAFEGIILWVEARFFMNHLTEHTRLRRLLFSVTANLASFGLGFLVLLQSGGF